MKLLPLNLPSGVIIVILFLLIAVLTKNGSRFVEGMTTATTSPMDALRNQMTALQTTYDKLDNAITSQTNTINGNSQMLYKIMSDAPTQSNNITHANVNMDDPSKTPIKKTINMS
jgi:hypothetical protein